MFLCDEPAVTQTFHSIRNRFFIFFDTKNITDDYDKNCLMKCNALQCNVCFQSSVIFSASLPGFISPEVRTMNILHFILTRRLSFSYTFFEQDGACAFGTDS